MQRVTTSTDLRSAVAAARAAGRRIGFVPTMGALHEGHLSLIRAAAATSDFVVVSIFVNPLQFGAGEDLDAYPRDLDADETLMRALGQQAPDLVFAPPAHEVYPRPMVTAVHVSGLTEGLCGASRPGHFDGVTTVVNKLFNLVRPDIAHFGRKDFQQLQTIRRMVADLDMAVEVAGEPIVREPDGVAMSSRNRYLDEAHRHAATALSRALAACVVAARASLAGGEAPTAGMLTATARVILDTQPNLTVDYVEVLDPDTLAPPDPTPVPREQDGEVAAPPDGAGATALLVAVAAQVGPARLIDNVLVGDREDEDRLLQAVQGRDAFG